MTQAILPVPRCRMGTRPSRPLVVMGNKSAPRHSFLPPFTNRGVELVAQKKVFQNPVIDDKSSFGGYITATMAER